jgi:hypothetical protein
MMRRNQEQQEGKINVDSDIEESSNILDTDSGYRPEPPNKKVRREYQI